MPLTDRDHRMRRFWMGMCIFVRAQCIVSIEFVQNFNQVASLNLRMREYKRHQLMFERICENLLEIMWILSLANGTDGAVSRWWNDRMSCTNSTIKSNSSVAVCGQTVICVVMYRIQFLCTLARVIRAHVVSHLICGMYRERFSTWTGMRWEDTNQKWKLSKHAKRPWGRPPTYSRNVGKENTIGVIDFYLAEFPHLNDRIINSRSRLWAFSWVQELGGQ